jgi:hypothetical protein
MMQDQKVRIAIGLIIGIIIGVGGYSMFFKSDTTNQVSNSNQNGSTQEPATTNPTFITNSTIASSTIAESGSKSGVQGAGPGIIVDEQNPGRVVVVTEAAFQNVGWVVIHENDKDKPGKILGARLFNKGKNSGVIEIAQPMQAGQSYYAVLHNDDGTKTVFDPAKDTEVKNTQGQVVMVKFNVTRATD